MSLYLRSICMNLSYREKDVESNSCDMYVQELSSKRVPQRTGQTPPGALIETGRKSRPPRGTLAPCMYTTTVPRLFCVLFYSTRLCSCLLLFWRSLTLPLPSQMRLREIKHGRLAMAAFAFHYAGVLMEKKGVVVGHQLWGSVCVYNLKWGLSSLPPPICYPRPEAALDTTLSWEIMYRVLSGFFKEPYY